MDSKVTIRSPVAPGIILESVDTSHLEMLRQWKNANRFRFFHQEMITDSQQRDWYQGYISRQDDCMFIVKNSGNTVGCMGVRREQSTADIYNILRGTSEVPINVMATAFRMLCSYGLRRFDAPVRGKILVTNAAVYRWVRKNGMVFIKRGDWKDKAYYDVEFDHDFEIELEVTVIA